MTKKTLLAAMYCGLFFGCTPTKKIERHYNEYRTTHREQFAGDCAESFPTVETFKPGVPETKVDTVFVPGPTVDCPPGAKTVKCPDCPKERITTIIRDTITKTGGPREEMFRLNALTYHDSSRIYRLERDVNEERGDDWRKKALWGWGIIAAITIFSIIKIVLKIYKRFTI